MSQSLFTSQTPIVNNAQDGAPGIVTATALSFAKSGTVPAIRFYATNAALTGNFVAELWEVTTMDGGGAELGAGTLLASKTVLASTIVGNIWNNITFDSPVSVVPGKVYKAALWTEKFYVASNGFFAGSSLVNGDITAWADGTTGLSPSGTLDQGTFNLGASPGIYPKKRGASACYFVDVLFDASVASPTVKVWNGSSEVTAASVKVWDGSAEQPIGSISVL